MSAANEELDIIPQAIKLKSPRPDFDNLLITYLCLYEACKSDFNFEINHFSDAKSFKKDATVSLFDGNSRVFS